MSAWQRGRGRRAGWLFLLPALALLVLFVVWPLLRAVWWSLNATDLLTPDRQHWLGGAQYSALLRDERFRRAFANTALFALLVVPAQTALAFLLALWVTRPEREWRWLRAVFVVPTMVAMPALAVIWTALYQPSEAGESGPVNALLLTVGMTPHAWLREPSLALPALLAFSAVVALIILPVEVLAIPLFFTARELGLGGGGGRSLHGLSLPFVAKAFNIYFLRQQFLSLPTELEEAALRHCSMEQESGASSGASRCPRSGQRWRPSCCSTY